MGSLQLEDIIDGQDDLPTGKCCNKITDIEMVSPLFLIQRENIPLGAVQMDMYCFRILLEDTEWVLCHDDKAKATQAKNMIVLGVIKHYFWTTGNLGNLSILSSDAFANLGWSWDEQDEWMGTCKDGKTQSPIIIKPQETVQKENMRIIPKWQSLSVPVANFDGHEMVIQGDFGQTVFQLLDRTKIYNAKEIRIKMPAEHRFGEKQAGAEMQIYHTSNSGQEAIASIFINSGSDGSTDHNQFIENLEIEGWKLSSGKPYRLDARPDLSQIVKGGVTAYFQKTFYYYKGSLTTPPCTQGVDRFIFKDSLLIPATQFNNLKNKLFNVEAESGGNSRKAKKSDGITIFYHVDKSINCKMASNKVLEAAEEEVSKIESTKSKSYEGKFIKARTSLNTYGAFFGGGFGGSISDPARGVEVIEIPEAEVPADVRAKIGKEEYDRVTKYTKEVLTKKGIDSSKVSVKRRSSEDYVR